MIISIRLRLLFQFTSIAIQPPKARQHTQRQPIRWHIEHIVNAQVELRVQHAFKIKVCTYLEAFGLSIVHLQAAAASSDPSNSKAGQMTDPANVIRKRHHFVTPDFHPRSSPVGHRN
jgi:hypothetical protein